tara:strand:+ start:135 stop:341 length:207 start_codon:yes stop_codon:yes gene_type:complete
MKHLSEKQRRRQIKLSKSRFVKGLKRKARRKMLNLNEERIKVASRRLGRLQRQMIKQQMRTIRESSNS